MWRYDDIHKWAQSFLGRTFNVPKSTATIVAIAYELGKNGRGVWFYGWRSDNGERDGVYRRFPVTK